MCSLAKASVLNFAGTGGPDDKLCDEFEEIGKSGTDGTFSDIYPSWLTMIVVSESGNFSSLPVDSR